MARRVIILRGDPVQSEEDKTDEELLPGHLLEFDPTTGNLVKNRNKNVEFAIRLALERDELGRGIDVPYAPGDTVRTGTFAPGMRAYVFLASGENVIKGDYLTGGGTSAPGLFTEAGSEGRLAMALEALDLTGSAPVTGTRIRVEIV